MLFNNSVCTFSDQAMASGSIAQGEKFCVIFAVNSEILPLHRCNVARFTIVQIRALTSHQR